MTQLAQMAQGPLGNTKPRARARAYVFTLNNWTVEEYGTMTQEVMKAESYIIGKEIGENKTPHLQGYIRYKNPVEFSKMKKIMPRAHIEKAMGTLEENFKYCSKQNDYITNIQLALSPEEEYDAWMKSRYDDIKWHPWQEEILNIIDEPADERKVYWFYEEEGNKGKSFLARYLDWKYDAIIANGKQSDVFNQYKAYLETRKKQPKLAIIDIPRSHREYVCYSTFEKIKDGLFYSGKYEGGRLRITPHHLIIFANFKPEKDKMSLDRWIITHIG